MADISKIQYILSSPSPDIKQALNNIVYTIQDLSTGGSAAWGAITGTLSDQTDLQSALDEKLKADGTNAGSTSQRTDFGTFGIEADEVQVNQFITDDQDLNVMSTPSRLLYQSNGSSTAMDFSGVPLFPAGLNTQSITSPDPLVNTTYTGSDTTKIRFAPATSTVTLGDVDDQGNGCKMILNDLTETVSFPNVISLEVDTVKTDSITESNVGNGVQLGPTGTNINIDQSSLTITHRATHHYFDIAEYINNAAAITAGLTAGDLYHTAGVVMIVT